MAKVSLDYNFAMSSRVCCGASNEDLEGQMQKAHKGFARLADMVKSKEVGFTELPYQKLDEIKSMAKDLYRKYNDLVVIGIGGSALGFEAIVNAMLPNGYNSLSFADRRGFPRYWLLDNADPTLANNVLKYCNPEDTYVIVISKSGSTLETIANFCLIYEWLKSKSVDMKKHMCVVTDSEKGPLREFAVTKGIRAFSLPGNVGGRYSVLSCVGLLPAAVLGVDVDKILAGAAKVVESDWRQFTTMAALYMYFIDQDRSVNVIMPYSSRLVKFSEWFCQLWGESLGKRFNHRGEEVYFGTTPLRATGAIDQHSLLQLFREGPDDKFVTFVGLDIHEFDKVLRDTVSPAFSFLQGHKIGELLNAEMKATEVALAMAFRPSMRLNLGQLDEVGLGQLFMLFQYVVAIIGLANEIDPFNQPGVEEGKDFAYGIMGHNGYEEKKKQFEQLYVESPEYIV